MKAFHIPAGIIVAVTGLVFAAMLAGCSSGGSLTPQVQNTINAVCAADPVAYALGQEAGALVPVPQVQAGLTVDAALVHPLVVGACAKLGKVPVAAAPAAP